MDPNTTIIKWASTCNCHEYRWLGTPGKPEYIIDTNGFSAVKFVDGGNSSYGLYDISSSCPCSDYHNLFKGDPSTLVLVINIIDPDFSTLRRHVWGQLIHPSITYPFDTDKRQWMLSYVAVGSQYKLIFEVNDITGDYNVILTLESALFDPGEYNVFFITMDSAGTPDAIVYKNNSSVGTANFVTAPTKTGTPTICGPGLSHRHFQAWKAGLYQARLLQYADKVLDSTERTNLYNKITGFYGAFPQ